MRQAIICLLVLLNTVSSWAEERRVSLRHHPYEDTLKECALTGRLKRASNINELRFMSRRRRHLVRAQDNELGVALDTTHLGEFAQENDRHLFHYLRPEALQFIQDLALEYASMFQDNLRLTSLARPEDYQVFVNRKYDAAMPPNCTAHATGSALDISKRGMTREQREWIRSWLLRLERARIAEAWETNAIFHITVSPEYKKLGGLNAAYE